MRKSTLLTAILGAILLPIGAGTLTLIVTTQDVMTYPAPAPLASLPDSSCNAADVLILLSASGTSAADVLIPTEVFARAGKNVRTAAPNRQLIPLTGSLALIPDCALENAPIPKILILPSLMPSEDPRTAAWLRQNARTVQTGLAFGEGVRFLATSVPELNLTDATSHPTILADLSERFPATRWVESVAPVRSGNWVTSPGLAGACEASRSILAILEKSAAHPIYCEKTTTQTPAPKLSKRDYLFLFERAAFAWKRKNVGIFLDDGVTEGSLAALLDTLPRALTWRIVTVANERRAYRTAHGLWIVPALAAKEAPPLDLEIKANAQAGASAKQPTVADFSGALGILEKEESQALSTVVSKLVVFPDASDDANPPPFRQKGLFRVLLLAGLGAVLGVGLDRILLRRARTG